MRVLYVHAYFSPRVQAPESVYPDDWMAPGIYQVLVPADIPHGVAALCAYLTFHHIIPVKHMYCIELTIREPTGLEVLPDFEVENAEDLVALSGPLTKLLPAPHLSCRPGWLREEYAKRRDSEA